MSGIQTTKRSISEQHRLVTNAYVGALWFIHISNPYIISTLPGNRRTARDPHIALKQYRKPSRDQEVAQKQYETTSRDQHDAQKQNGTISRDQHVTHKQYQTTSRNQHGAQKQCKMTSRDQHVTWKQNKKQVISTLPGNETKASDQMNKLEQNDSQCQCVS